MNAVPTRRILLVPFVALLLWAGTASAGAPLLRDEAMTAAAFPAEAERIEAALAAGEWQRLGPGAEAEVRAGLRRIAGWLEDGEDRELAMARNEQLRINALLAPALTASNTSEVVCRRVKAVGSNIPSTVCHRREALEAHSRDVQNDLIRQDEFRVGGPRVDETNVTIQGRNYGRD